MNLLTNIRFWPLFWTQLLGAFNDNIFKNALVILITMQAYSLGGIAPEQMVALCGGIFIVPFLLFSSIAGQLADRYSKSKLISWVKISEIVVMLIGAIGFYFSNIQILLVTLFFMGLQSAFFGPIKYSILPQLLKHDELTSGTAYVELGTFLAILLGTIIAGPLTKTGGIWLGCLVIIMAIIGFITAKKVIPLEAEAPDLKFSFNIYSTTLELLKIARKNRAVFQSILGISWFWFIGAIFLSILPTYTKNYLHGEENLMTFFLALFSIGIGVGSVFCEKLSFKKLELGLVPFGSIGISVFAIDLFLVGASFNVVDTTTISTLLSSFNGWRLVFDLTMFSVFSGFFIVPLYTLMQKRSQPSERSRVIAANNILNALFMVVASVLLVIFYQVGLTIPQIFLALGVMNAVVAIYIYTVVPEFLFRFICWISANLLYRLKVCHRDNIPLEGPALLICNHVSFIDWMIIASASPRPIRFVMHYTFLEVPFTGRIFKDAKVIPIAGSKENHEILDQAFDRIKEELQAGELVCIFPEGKLTADGDMNPFRPGMERIIQETPVPVIPLALNGMWGSFFSRKDDKVLMRPFRRFWSKITLLAGEAIPANEVSAEALYKKVSEMRTTA